MRQAAPEESWTTLFYFIFYIRRQFCFSVQLNCGVCVTLSYREHSKLHYCASGSPVAATQWQHYNTQPPPPDLHTPRPTITTFYHGIAGFFLAEKGWTFFHSFFMQISFRLQSLSNCARLLQWRIKNKNITDCITTYWVKQFDTVYLRSEISIHQRDLSFDSVNGWFPAALQNYWYWSDFLAAWSMGGTTLTLSLDKEACSLYIYINLTTSNTPHTLCSLYSRKM